jgi:hypothetical protein
MMDQQLVTPPVVLCEGYATRLAGLVTLKTRISEVISSVTPVVLKLCRNYNTESVFCVQQTWLLVIPR